ncbi:MAG: RNase adapter RapZ [Halofilum sp. (in: g-proteobacteria)]|nr:RNase adapter RapZ [Halofilum sp. (in: g-proteobacteria)]
MRLVIVSGLSGSGKSVALHTLEDEGFYCIDNLPPPLLLPLVDQLADSALPLYERVAVGVDARSDSGVLDGFPETVERLRANPRITLEILFLHTDHNTLLKRFSETRRKHPLSQKGMPLAEAIEAERSLLATVSEQADLAIETSNLTLHELRSRLRERLLKDEQAGLSLLFQSFGFKNGVPADTDFTFDLRCLPNPHWEPHLRLLTGQDPEVAAYLERHEDVAAMHDSIRDLLERWIPAFEREGRSYLTVSLGCTGGQHRSVYLADRLADHFRAGEWKVSVRHREL